MKFMKHVLPGIVVMCCVAASATMAQQDPAPAKSWTDNIRVKGDLRYREELINDDSKLNKDKDTFTRERQRIRARAGIEAKMSDTLKGEIELSTGQSDPVSGNQTIGDIFGKKDMKLNLAYFDWTLVNQDPQLVNVIGGKMKNPFICVSDLVWDPDMTPEGLAAKAQAVAGPVTFMGNAAYWWLQERNTDNNDDTTMVGAQGAIRIQPVDEFWITLGVSYYSFDNLKGYDVMDWEGKNNSYGNSTVAGSVSGTTSNKAYKFEYVPVEFFVELGFYAGTLPVTLFGQTVSNGEADGNDTGYQAGFVVGKAKNPNTFEAGYSYAELKKDAVLGALTDSDRWGGGTDGRGHKMQGKYQFTKNFQTAATYFVDDKTISDPSKTKDYDRLQLDLLYKF